MAFETIKRRAAIMVVSVEIIDELKNLWSSFYNLGDAEQNSLAFAVDVPFMTVHSAVFDGVYGPIKPQPPLGLLRPINLTKTDA